jgi:LysR family transcriptional regulator, glycine cleavage system transcriptional activator
VSLRPLLSRDLRVFCVAARCLSFSETARALNVTPSAVSHQIRRIEQQLAIKLFARKARAIELTAAGQTLVDEIEPLLESIDRAVRRVARNRSARTLRVVLPPLFSSELFLPRLPEFQAIGPNVDLEIKTMTQFQDRHDAGADVSVVLTQSKPRGVEGWRLFKQILVAAAAPKVAAKLREQGRAALKDVALVVHKTRPDAFNRWLKAAGFGAAAPRNVLALDAMPAVVRAAEEGVGVALVPSRLCAPRFATGSLVRISAVEITTEDSYFLVHRREDGARTEVRALTSWMLSEFRAG